jgi:large subunit ribosomal protein L4
LEDLNLDTHKTKEFANMLSKFQVDNALVVTAERNENASRGLRNIPYVNTALACNLNVYDIMKHDKFISSPRICRCKLEECLCIMDRTAMI